MARKARPFRASPKPVEIATWQAPVLLRYLRSLPPDQLAECLPFLVQQGRLALLSRLDPHRLAEALAHLELAQQVEVLAHLPAQRVARILEAVDPDDAADLIKELPAGRGEELLGLMGRPEAEEIRSLLAYPPDTAGGLMTPDYVAIAPELTVAEALETLRRRAPEAETIYYVYVVGAGRLRGVISLRDLLVADPTRRIAEVMRTRVETVHLRDDKEEVARRVARYDLLAIPVVDDEGRLHGVVTVDDIVDVLEEIRIAELMERVGSHAVELQKKTPVQVAMLRLPWLMVTLGIELLAGLVVHSFSATLARFILLASFMPIISAVSGNVGLQSSTVMVRGLESRVFRSWWASFAREMQTDLLIGCVAGAALGGVAAIWAGKVGMGIVVAVSTLTAMSTAGFMGSVFPVVSSRLGFDPAVTAGPFETSFQDIVGFLVFLGLATILSGWLV